MKTQELIKQAEEWMTKEYYLVQQLVDKLKRYEEATILLKRGSCWCEVAIGNPMYTEHTQGCILICKALEE